MSVAFAVWNNRVAPVFDTARDFLIMELKDGVQERRSEVRVAGGDVQKKVEVLKSQGVSCLVCGAISQMARHLVEAEKIVLISFISGDIESVLEGWSRNELMNEVFRMPGCRCRRMRRGGFGREFNRGTGGGGGRGRGVPPFRGV